VSTPPMLGAFARIFHVQTAAQLADAFRAHSLTQVQLNLSTFGMPTIPTEAEASTDSLDAVGRVLTSAGLALWGISATFNAAHPDDARRRAEVVRAADFVGRLGGTGATAATLCSGSRDPDDMWGFHAETGSEAAWRDFRASLDALLPAAERSGVVLAVEPEPANTVSDVDRARRLQRELGDEAARVGFILDPANLITGVDPGRHRYTLERAFEELGPQTICVHAKDTVPWSATLRGEGVVDYGLVMRLFDGLPARVPLIIQDAAEDELGGVIGMLGDAMSRSAA